MELQNKTLRILIIKEIEGLYKFAGHEVTKDQVIEYNLLGEILDANGKATGNKVVLTAPGRPLQSDGKITILDENNEKITDHKYELTGFSVPVYSDQMTSMPFSSVTKIF